MGASGCLIALLISVSPTFQDANKPLDDLAQLQGVWRYASLEINSQPLPAQLLAAAKIEITGDRFVTTSQGGVYKGTFKIDTAKNPKTIDITITEGPEKGVNHGIYELKGDSWKMCLDFGGQNRPQSFAAKGATIASETLTKQKAPAKPANDELAKFDGEWEMVSGQANGQALPEESRKQFKRVAKDGVTTVTVGNTVFMKAKFSVDPSKKPKQINYDMLEGPTKGQKQLGIYEFDGENLKFCFAAPGADRPSEFTSTAGSGRTLSVWKRVKK